MLNYLIAILSTTYENMKQSGIFKYKVNLFLYSERFMISFNDPHYGQMVQHPPPFTYLNIVLIPFIVSRRFFEKVSVWFSFFMYWVENVIYLLSFIIYEALLLPLAYFKILFYNIPHCSIGFGRTICNTVVWLLLGLFVCLWFIIQDCWYLLRILAKTRGCRIGMANELDDTERPPEFRANIYNEVRESLIYIYLELKKHFQKLEREDSIQSSSGLSSDSDRKDTEEHEFFFIDEDEGLKGDCTYVVQKSLIVEEWKKRRAKKMYAEQKAQEAMINVGLHLRKAIDRNKSIK